MSVKQSGRRSRPHLLCYLYPALMVSLFPVNAYALLCGTVLEPLSVTVSQIDYGIYDPTSAAPNQANGMITLSCALNLDILPSFTVSLSEGTSASFTTRRMTAGSAQLSYNLYSAPDYSSIWGNGSAATISQSSSGLLLSAPVVFTVYGQIPAGQYVPAGGYMDTIVVSITY